MPPRPRDFKSAGTAHFRSCPAASGAGGGSRAGGAVVPAVGGGSGLGGLGGGAGGDCGTVAESDGTDSGATGARKYSHSRRDNEPAGRPRQSSAVLPAPTGTMTANIVENTNADQARRDLENPLMLPWV